VFQDPEVIDLLECVHKSLLPVFNVYAENENMSLLQFSQFVTEFGIVPDVLPLEVIENHFSTLTKFG